MSAEQLVIACLSLPSWRWVCETRRWRHLLMEYIITWRRLDARLIKLLSGATDLESLSGQQLIDAAVYVWRKKGDHNGKTATERSADTPTSGDSYFAPGHTSPWASHIPSERTVSSPEYLQPQIPKCRIIEVCYEMSRDLPDDNFWKFVKGVASEMEKFQVLMLTIEYQPASRTNEGVIWRALYEQFSRGSNTWLLNLSNEWFINIKQRPEPISAGQSTSSDWNSFAKIHIKQHVGDELYLCLCEFL